MSAGGWLRAITLQSAGPWKVDGSRLVGTLRSATTIGQQVVLQAPRIATSWPSHAPGGA
jgi:hypothetical protein